MRQMMEGVVLFGTGRAAQLDGYSAGGKTGTAEKIDPATHTYSKTKYVASFVGFAPVSSPAVTIAIVMDSPTKVSHYGATVSAPVFHDLAQQILEYLGVPHDQELKPTNLIAKDTKPVEEETPQEETANLESLFAEANHLPADDPLSSSASADTTASANAAGHSSQPDAGQVASMESAQNSPPAAVEAKASPPTAAVVQPARMVLAAMSERVENGSVSVPNQRVAVPSFMGRSLREVVVEASAASLGVRVVGSGVAREQAPAAGTMVPSGTEIVVRFAQ
jgi:cell division protein FtsI (penicillin-binding protein 3)